jgi:hypothetical protein
VDLGGCSKKWGKSELASKHTRIIPPATLALDIQAAFYVVLYIKDEA